MSTPTEDLKIAKRGPIVSIFVYLVLAIAKLLVGFFLNASSLIADGFNNLSDIVGNVTLLIGLQLASRPADQDHRFGHWKIEDLSSLLTSIIMFIVGIQVLIETIQKIFSNEKVTIDRLGAIVGIISAIALFLVYLYNKHLSKKVRSSALVAASKDNLSDAVTSLGTSIAIIAASLHLPIIDRIAAIIITYFILKTAYDIFMESAFSLSDGFDERQLKKYEKAILEIPKISAVKSQRGRTYGSNIFLDIVLEMNPDLSVYESHAITEQVEELLSERFSVYDIDVHVEPAPIPEDEIFENVFQNIYRNEKMILAKVPGYETYISSHFYYINASGEWLSAEQFLNLKESFAPNFKSFKIDSISQKTKLVTYILDGQRHSSIWRRNETWFILFHQVTESSKPHITKHYQIRRLNKKE
ncbi:cation diffusion facilitator family transporter [Streptococcus urinalis FB127-CNA-2]|uniref:Cation diffusion facilitator family transporter n=1 Tax=Streptococcus urinalis 2285-97 TaxID=764291 RepID=G5KGH6_9STRE|nr:cation diffusion facilitator family transporter [Streptococcus urinalis]EHJ56762.1 cation diffusion facilitator family transporter [Streptococcus urinalis 2285-97]EKS22343.1 cation diffusion facilitator family transporter [Streptococcus urinalis FB127-CNA-2]VEF32156.1 Cobalt-zinc-cadmium resistance protein [Streptococcus urinalis]